MATLRRGKAIQRCGVGDFSHHLVGVNLCLSHSNFKPGPLYAPFIIADEINRGPSKVQATMLETMAERQISRVDQTVPDLPYSGVELEKLIELRNHGRRACFDVDLPDPTNS